MSNGSLAVRSGGLRRRAGWGWALGAALMFLLPGIHAAADPLSTNSGGVLFLHVVSLDPFQADTSDICSHLKPIRLDEVRASMPADGVPRLVVVYAAFPKDSIAVLRAMCFGLRYSEGVKLSVNGSWQKGPCHSVALEVPESRWPASNSGTLMAWSAAEVVEPGVLFPVYWFAASSTQPGYLEVTPHPMPNYGGRFTNNDLSPYMMAISDFGQLGFGLEGRVPRPGAFPVKGGCCLDGCYLLWQVECDFYKGIFLGAHSSCENTPCGPEAIKGACCLSDGTCEMHSQYDCARLKGVYQGDGLACGTIPCPGTGQDRTPAAPSTQQADSLAHKGGSGGSAPRPR